MIDVNNYSSILGAVEKTKEKCTKIISGEKDKKNQKTFSRVVEEKMSSTESSKKSKRRRYILCGNVIKVYEEVDGQIKRCVEQVPVKDAPMSMLSKVENASFTQLLQMKQAEVNKDEGKKKEEDKLQVQGGVIDSKDEKECKKKKTHLIKQVENRNIMTGRV